MLKINLTNLNHTKINNITELLNLTKENDVFYLKDIIENNENKMNNLISNTFNFDTNLSKVCTSYHAFKILDVFNSLCLNKIKSKNHSNILYTLVNNRNNIMTLLTGYNVYYNLCDFNNFAHLFIWLRLTSSMIDCDILLVDILNTMTNNNDTEKVISILLSLYSYIINIDILDDLLHDNFYDSQYHQYKFLNTFIRKQLEPYNHIIVITPTTTKVVMNDDNNKTPDIVSIVLLTMHDMIATTT